MITDLRKFKEEGAEALKDGSKASAAGASSTSTLADTAKPKQKPVLGFNLRDKMFVGERYTIEVLDSGELEFASVEFYVEEPQSKNQVQNVEVRVTRKTRDVNVALRYLREETEPVPIDIRNQSITVTASHEDSRSVKRVEAATKGGAAVLEGIDSLFVGQRYLLEVAETDQISAHERWVTIPPGKAALMCEVHVGPASGRIQIQFTNGMKNTGHPLADLPLPPITFAIHPVPRTGLPKCTGVTDSTGYYQLQQGSQLYINREYTIEVGAESNKYEIEPKTQTFKVQKRGVTHVDVPLMRASGDVRALFTTVHANTLHWSAPLKLPSPFEFRIVHRRTGKTAYEATVERQPSHTLSQQIFSKYLCIGEPYTLEVGYQLAAIVSKVSSAVKALTNAKSISFNGAGEAALPDITAAWSIQYHGDSVKKQANHELLDEIAKIMRANPIVHMDVHAETGSADWAAAPLAEYYRMRRTEDVQLLLDHLARNRAHAVVNALTDRGVDPQRLSPTFRGRTGRLAVSFRPRAPRRTKLGDPKSGLEHLKTHFVVQPPDKLGTAQEVKLQLMKATGDLKVVFNSSHADTKHWSHYLTVPHGVRLTVRHTALNTLITEGVVTTSDNSCTIIGSAAPRQLWGNEHYTLEIHGGRYFEQDPNSILLKPGLQKVPMRVTWSTRMVRCYVTSADADGWRTMQAKEAYNRICAFLLVNDVVFNGAGERLPQITQAWSIAHTDEKTMRRNRETIGGIAAILKEYPALKITVHGETGAASSAPRALADHLGLHYTHDVGLIMDQLAENRATACIDALVEQGVPRSQLIPAHHGRMGGSKVDFVPEGAVRKGDPATKKKAEEEVLKMKRELAPLPAGIPYELRLAKGGSIIMAGITGSNEPEVFCQLPHKERLVVGQRYVFEAFNGPGTEPNVCEFVIDPEEILERDILEVRLPVRRSKHGEILVTCEDAEHHGHWSRKLPLPLSVPYEVLDHTGCTVITGLIPDAKGGDAQLL